jgi:hypothetical protein
MHCLQGSDAHRLVADPRNPKRLGIGDRATELMLDAPTFEAITEVLRSRQYDRVRPARPDDKPFDPLDVVREEGPTLTQSFHESAAERGGKLAAILADLCAFANTAGGAVYVGCKPGKGKMKGLLAPAQTEQEVRAALEDRLTPRLEARFEMVQSQEAKVLRIQAPKGPDLPYALDGNKFYVRDEAETSLAVRDEIVALVKEALGFEHEAAEAETGVEAGLTPPVFEPPVAITTTPLPELKTETTPERGGESRTRRGGRGRGQAPAQSANGAQAKQPPAPQPKAQSKPAPRPQARQQPKAQPAVAQAAEARPEEASRSQSTAAPSADTTFYLPQVGVEIVDSEERNGHLFHTIRDLRNGHVIKNVTRNGARKLWSYAIAQREDHPVALEQIAWQGDLGVVHFEKRAGKVRYDLALREGDTVRVFYGVTDEGMEGAWAQFLAEEA